MLALAMEFSRSTRARTLRTEQRARPVPLALPASRSTPSEEGVLAEAAMQADRPNSQRIDFEPPDRFHPGHR
jgi:hypothetical protein